MKKFSLYTFAFLVAALTIFSCKEKERAFPEFADIEHGAYARMVSNGVAGDLDYENPNNHDSSSLTFTVEFYDENQGNDVVEYSWTAKYGDNFGPTTFKTYTKSDFTKNADGLPELTATFTFEEIFAALNMTIADFELTTDFQLDATLTMANGKKFTFVNSGTNVVGQPTFNSFFRYTPPVTKKPCNSVLAGTYNAKVTVTDQMAGIGWDACGGNTWEGVVRFEAEHDETTFDPGSYIMYSTDPTLAVELEDASMGAYYGCYTVAADGSNLPLGDLRFIESCGKMGFTGGSQWGEVWSFVKVEVDGATLTLGLVNDYGEGGEVELTRTDGTAWQTDLFCEGC